MPPDNVLRFSRGNQPRQEWGIKLFVVAYYLLLGYTFAVLMLLSPGGLTLLLVLGLLYHFGLRSRHWQQTGYWQKNGWLIGVIAVLLILVLWPMPLVILIIAGLYWLLIGRHHANAPHFAKYHILTGLLLNGLLLLPLMILSTLVLFLGSLFDFLRLSAISSPFLSFYGLYINDVVQIIFLAANVLLAISALRGRTPYLPVVTPNVRVMV